MSQQIENTMRKISLESKVMDVLTAWGVPLGTKDNLFYTFCSAIPIWTAYEVITFWAFANQLIPYVSWEIYPIYCCFMFFLIPFIRDAHFYLAHRLLHWGPLYRIAHKVHHP